MSKPNFTPLGRRVLVLRNPVKSVSDGGLHLPDVAISQQRQAKVISVGAAVESVKPGQQVLLQEYGGTSLKLDGTEYLLVSEFDILATIQRQPA